MILAESSSAPNRDRHGRHHGVRYGDTATQTSRVCAAGNPAACVKPGTRWGQRAEGIKKAESENAKEFQDETNDNDQADNIDNRIHDTFL